MCIRDRFASKFNELEQSIEKMGVWKINTDKYNTNENNEEINDKVRNVVNTSENNGDIYVNSNGVSLNTKQVAVDKVNNNDNSNNELFILRSAQ